VLDSIEEHLHGIGYVCLQDLMLGDLICQGLVRLRKVDVKGLDKLAQLHLDEVALLACSSQHMGE
jgi:hypothetical protein